MTINDIPIGGYFTVGLFQRRNRRAPEPISWRKASYNNEFYGDDGLGAFSADEREPENESRDRRERGSNFFPQTNICQFLNSEEVDWFKPQHETDTVNDLLGRQPGFLHLFEDWERSSIIPHEITAVVPSGFKRKYGETFKTTLKVSMLSKSQLSLEDGNTEGEPLGVFQMGAIPTGFVTRTAVGSGLVAIDERRRTINSSPAVDFNILPFAVFNGNSLVEYSEAGGCYYLLPPAEFAKEVTDELHQLLK